MASLLRGFPAALEPGRPGDPGLFGPDSVAWRVNGEVVLLVGAGRALLMQLAHPAVAAGVVEHSDFRDDPYARLWRTLGTMLTVTFGDTEQSRRAAQRVNVVHHVVRGEGYDALDPALLLWVHATLVDSALVVHDRFVGGLSSSERERYYRDMKRQAAALRVPLSHLPGNVGEFDRYVRKQVGSLEVSDQGRSLARKILAPPVPLPLRPAALTFRMLTAGLLPERLRSAFGLRWGRAHELGLGTAAGLSRAVLPAVPELLRRWPAARAACRRVAAGE